MKGISKTGAMIAALVLCGTGSASAATLFEDDFSADHISSGYLTVTDLTNWNVVQGNVDILAPSLCGFGDCIDLDGSFSADPAIIETKTTFSFTAGATYSLFFDMPTGQASDAFTISVGSLLSESFTGYGALAPTLVFSPGADTLATIKITMGDTPNNLGPWLTKVTLSETLAAVPLPGAFPLLLFALGGLGLAARRRKAG